MDHLLAAGRAVGARRFVAQGFAAFRFARTGGLVLTEADPLDPDRLAAGEAATLMMTDARVASNEKAKRQLGWRPRHASWRLGFAQGLG